MIVLTEEQRLEAIAICERIEQSADRLQKGIKEAVESLEQMKRDFPFPLRTKE